MSQAHGNKAAGGVGTLMRSWRARVARWWSQGRHYRPERRYMRGAKAAAK